MKTFSIHADRDDPDDLYEKIVIDKSNIANGFNFFKEHIEPKIGDDLNKLYSITLACLSYTENRFDGIDYTMDVMKRSLLTLKDMEKYLENKKDKSHE